MARCIDSIDLPVPTEGSFGGTADFSRTAEGDPGTCEARRLASGRNRLGSRLRKLIAVGLVAICLSEQSARAAEIEGVRFLDRLTAVAALYLGESLRREATSESVLADVPRRLEIEYFWAIPADKFANATVQGISRGTDPETFERLRTSVDQINGLYESVEPGDRYALTYVPGVGTELALNGRRLGVVEGADFSAALFAIWIGDKPLDESLREQLLAGV